MTATAIVVRVLHRPVRAERKGWLVEIDVADGEQTWVVARDLTWADAQRLAPICASACEVGLHATRSAMAAAARRVTVSTEAKP